jgi:hypothetical protein
MSFHGTCGSGGEEVVLKRFLLQSGCGIGSVKEVRTNYMTIMETQTVAAYLASGFNKVIPKINEKSSQNIFQWDKTSIVFQMG